MQEETGFDGIKIEMFQQQLEGKMSRFNAKMILDSAFVVSGITSQMDVLDKTQSQNLCLALIKRGGPAFQVGTQIYKKYLQ